MNQWINQFLENEIVNRTDKTDKPTNARPLSVLSVRPLRLLDEKLEKVKNNPETGTDKTDKPIYGGPLSVLSVRSPGLLDENLVNMPKPDISDNTDKTDRLGPNLNLSGLSGRPWGLLDEKMEKVENNLSKGGDKSDRFKFETNISPHEGGHFSVFSVPLKGPFAETSFYPLDGTSLLNEYQERLAIAEYEGHQNPCQAKRIAYLDAFMAVLATLPYKDEEGDWLGHRVKAAQAWLLDQGFVQPK